MVVVLLLNWGVYFSTYGALKWIFSRRGVGETVIVCDGEGVSDGECVVKVVDVNYFVYILVVVGVGVVMIFVINSLWVAKTRL